MPRAKRDKSVSLTKTAKRPPNYLKNLLTAKVQATVEEHQFIYVYTVANMRNSQLKNVRALWRDSRFFMGKTKVLQFGLGVTPETEVSTNLHELAQHVTPNCGLLFTTRPSLEVLQWFNDFKEEDFARAGNIATKTVNLVAGPMPAFSFAVEPHLRSLGLPTRLECSRVLLTTDYTVCKRGDVLTPNQAKILKHLGIRLAIFRITIKCYWNKKTGMVVFPEPVEYEPEPDLVQPVEEITIGDPVKDISVGPGSFASEGNNFSEPLEMES